MISSFKELKEKAQEKGEKRLVVACAEDRTVIEASMNALKEGLAVPIFVGDRHRIQQIATIHHIDLGNSHIEDSEDTEKSVMKAIAIVRSGKGDFLLKGMVKTSTFLKGLLDPEKGLRTNRRLSHCALLETKEYHKLIQLTDGGMNTTPDLETKIDIIKNSCDFSHFLGISKPKVALLAAIEVVNPEMRETVDAAILKQMGERGQLGNLFIDGPLAVDLAISQEACEKKGFHSDVGGDADILVVPDIAAGNIFAKGLIYLGNAKAAGIILGAKSPVVMLSRADDRDTKLNSIALGVLSC